MKKVILIAVAGLFVLASCKKDYTCECKFSGVINGSVSETITDTKKDAKAACDEGDTSSADQTVECEIK